MERISSIAQRLKEYRERFGLTLSDVSKKCKIPMQTLSRYELEQRVPKIDTAVEIANEIPPPFLRAGSFYFLTVAARLVASSSRVTKSRGRSMVPPTSAIKPASMARAI